MGAGGNPFVFIKGVGVGGGGGWGCVIGYIQTKIKLQIGKAKAEKMKIYRRIGFLFHHTGWGIEELVRIPFTTKTALAHAQECELEGVVSDFIFETNVEGLLLGAPGPIGLRATNALPRMRFVPHVLLFSDSEDEPGH